MSLLKTNEIQNYNGSSLTLTASTVSTSAQLNTGGNISVTGSLNVSDDSTTRTNLGLGTIATQDSSNVNLTGGTIGSSVVFPTGVVIGVDFYQEITSSGNQTSDYGWGTVRSVTLTSGQKCLIHISGGGLVGNDTANFGYGAIQFDTTTLTTSSQGSFAYGGQSYVDDLSVAANNPRIVIGSMATHLYTAASNVTLYFRQAVHASIGTASWSSGSDRPINIAIWKVA